MWTGASATRVGSACTVSETLVCAKAPDESVKRNDSTQLPGLLGIAIDTVRTAPDAGTVTELVGTTVAFVVETIIAAELVPAPPCRLRVIALKPTVSVVVIAAGDAEIEGSAA